MKRIAIALVCIMTMLQRLGRSLSRWSARYMPDPFIFALVLTFITYLLGILIARQGPLQMLQHWYNGFWELLAFGMQMVLILITGHALASAPLVKRLLGRIAAVPRNPVQAVYLTGFVSCVLGWIHWGFGLIGGGVLALFVAKNAQEKGMRLHYPLVVASAYLAMVIWHNGLSGSGPLLCATPGHFLEAETGIIPITETIFSSMNISISVAMMLICPLVMMLMLPSREDEIVPALPILLAEALPDDEGDLSPENTTPAERLENSVFFTVLICLMGSAYLLWYFATKGFSLNLDVLNFLFLVCGIAFWKTPVRYARAVAEATKGVSGVILQFPFYAGIMGMMKYSGMGGIIAGWFVVNSTETTYSIWVLVSAGLVNLFIPSGGGQVAVQGPIIVEAATKLNIPLPKAIMALAYGDELTNMIQPFWAIALLGIARLKPKDIMGYCIAAMLVAFIIMVLGLVLAG